MGGMTYTDEEREARAVLSRFTPENPLLVGRNVYQAMTEKPALADMMDRVRLYADLPAGPDVIIGDTAYDLKTYSSHELFIAGRTSGKMLAWAGALAASGILIITESHRIEEAREQMKAMRFHDLEIDQVLGQGRLRGDELRALKLTEIDPERTGRRYGPYDADPHTKGRRRRFRTQRRT